MEVISFPTNLFTYYLVKAYLYRLVNFNVTLRTHNKLPEPPQL